MRSARGGLLPARIERSSMISHFAAQNPGSHKGCPYNQPRMPENLHFLVKVNGSERSPVAGL